VGRGSEKEQKRDASFRFVTDYSPSFPIALPSAYSVQMAAATPSAQLSGDNTMTVVGSATGSTPALPGSARLEPLLAYVPRPGSSCFCPFVCLFSFLRLQAFLFLLLFQVHKSNFMKCSLALLLCSSAFAGGSSTPERPAYTRGVAAQESSERGCCTRLQQGNALEGEDTASPSPS
jgi:hypothetical protein